MLEIEVRRFDISELQSNGLRLTFLSDTSSTVIVSESKPSAFPSTLRAKRSAVQTLTAEDKQTEALTQHTCAQCGRKEMYYTALQLRSADEGSTIFYSCVCGYRYACPPDPNLSIAC